MGPEEYDEGSEYIHDMFDEYQHPTNLPGEPLGVMPEPCSDDVDIVTTDGGAALPSSSFYCARGEMRPDTYVPEDEDDPSKKTGGR